MYGSGSVSVGTRLNSEVGFGSCSYPKEIEDTVTVRRTDNRVASEVKKTRGRPLVASLLGSALVAAVAVLAVGHVGARSVSPKYVLTANVNFPVSADVYSGPVNSSSAVGCSGSVAKLYPGAARCLRYTVTNPLNVPIAVTSLSISSVSFSPSTTNPSKPACKVSDLSTTAFAPSSSSGYLTVASGATAYLGEPITLTDDLNQDNCKNGSFGFTINGSALYTARTQTVLAASPSPAIWGQAVTLTATVTSATPVQSPPSTTPSGTVTFYQCTNSACTTTTTLGGGSLNGSGVATLTYHFYPSSATTYNLLATYTPTSGSTDWLSSSSSQVPLTVGFTNCITANQNGGLTVPSGQTYCITSTGKVTGGVTVQPGGGLVYYGTVTGGITSTGAVGIWLCGTSVSGGVSVTGSTGQVVIGNGSSCAANSIKGGLTVSSNTGGVQIVGNNVTGGITVNNNSGPTPTSVQYVGGNSFTGGLACSGNVASLSNNGQPNSGSGTRSGQCAGSF